MAVDISVERNGETVRCAMRGELDLASQVHALDELIPLIQEADARVVLDLSGLEFIDSTGLRVLLSCLHQAEASGIQFVLASPSAPVQQLLDLTKMSDRFDYMADG